MRTKESLFLSFEFLVWHTSVYLLLLFFCILFALTILRGHQEAS